MPSYRVNFDLKALQNGVEKVLGKKVDKINLIETRTDAAGEYAKHIARYVPLDSGTLRRSARAVDGEVRYSAKAKRPGGEYDYAEIQYQIPFPQENRHTPDTYDHWNRHLTTAERQAFYEDVADILIRRMNDG